MEMKWTDGHRITVGIHGGTAVVSANKAGLLSLAAQLTALAEEKPGSHFHLDAYNGLEDASAELIVEVTG